MGKWQAGRRASPVSPIDGRQSAPSQVAQNISVYQNVWLVATLKQGWSTSIWEVLWKYISPNSDLSGFDTWLISVRHQKTMITFGPYSNIYIYIFLLKCLALQLFHFKFILLISVNVQSCQDPLNCDVILWAVFSSLILVASADLLMLCSNHTSKSFINMSNSPDQRSVIFCLTVSSSLMWGIDTHFLGMIAQVNQLNPVYDSRIQAT